MLRWITLAMALAGCSHDMSDREYCVRRQTAWEMAFPNLPQSEVGRAQFVDACVRNVAKAGDGELARSMRCMNEHLVGHGRAYDQYVAFTTCEQIDPSRGR